MKPRGVSPVSAALLVALTLLCVLASGDVTAQAVDPASVSEALNPGESVVVDKSAMTPSIPPVVDLCLLEDETGSFDDDIQNLQGGTTASDIYDAVVAASPGAHFAVAGFRDYPVSPFGTSVDWVYRLLSSMDPTEAAWLAGIAALQASGGLDTPEAQYDAIVAAAGPGSFNDPTLGLQGNAGWRDPDTTPGVQRVLLVTTDAPFHTPDGTHVNDFTSAVAALNAQKITLVGLKAPGAGGELDALAAATGGSVQPLSSDGSNIAMAILDGLAEVTTDVWWVVTYVDPGLDVSLTPDVHYDVPGDTAVMFTETIAVDPDPALYGATLFAVVSFYANEYPETGALLGEQTITITVPALPVEIDIKPRSDPNSFGCNAKGRIPVALLSSESFDALSVDPDTVRFGKTGTEASEAHVDRNGMAVQHVEDVNMDGLMDLVFHFEFEETGFGCDDIPSGQASVTLVGILTGTMYGGGDVVGEDDIRLTGKTPLSWR